MQKITTIIFITASITFAILGILLVLVPSQDSNYNQTMFFVVIQKAFVIDVFIVLSSFALTIASKYFTTKK